MRFNNKNQILPIVTIPMEKPYPYCPNDELWYTSSTGDIVNPNDATRFDAELISNTYVNGHGIYKFSSALTKIDYNAFNQKWDITGFTFPRTLTYLDGLARCGITSIIVPDTITTLAGACFNGCQYLTSAIIKADITLIDHNMFNGCTSLLYLKIPVGVTKFMYASLANCTSLSSIDYDGTMAQWGTIKANSNSPWWNGVVHCSDGDIERAF